VHPGRDESRELANATGLSVRTLTYYDEIGLIQAVKLRSRVIGIGRRRCSGFLQQIQIVATIGLARREFETASTSQSSATWTIDHDTVGPGLRTR